MALMEPLSHVSHLFEVLEKFGCVTRSDITNFWGGGSDALLARIETLLLFFVGHDVAGQKVSNPEDGLRCPSILTTERRRVRDFGEKSGNEQHTEVLATAI